MKKTTSYIYALALLSAVAPLTGLVDIQRTTAESKIAHYDTFFERHAAVARLESLLTPPNHNPKEDGEQ